ncbi:MAG: hypothetical protein K1X94_08515 [Sandaracinaceae bacterium]|nr:hypothetical protein [Sandaracinaceae bacterium]
MRPSLRWTALLTWLSIGCGRLGYAPSDVDAALDARTVSDASDGMDARLDASSDAGLDASSDAGLDAGLDASSDAGLDAPTSPDAGMDGGVLPALWARLDDYVKASNTGVGDGFGAAVAISADGSMMAIGAPGEDGSGTGVDPTVDEGSSESGAVYVFRSTGGGWVFDAYLKASDTGSNDRFGSALAFDSAGTMLAVGAPGEASNAALLDAASNELVPGCGAVYVYERDAGGWRFTERLKPSNPGSDLAFGGALDLSGDGAVLAIGAITEDSSGTGVDPSPDLLATGSGAVYVFRHTDRWAFDAFLKASNTSTGDGFGASVALSLDGNLLAVGAPNEDGGGRGVDPPSDEAATDSGAVYLYQHGVAWSFLWYLKASNTGAGDAFGSSVALDDGAGVLVVGATLEDGSSLGVGGADDDGALDTGAVYAFGRLGSSWSQEAYLKAFHASEDLNFGRSVALAGNGGVLAVGCPLESSGGMGLGTIAMGSAAYSGAVFSYARTAAGWQTRQLVKASNAGSDDRFGAIALSRDGSVLVVGAPQEDGAGRLIDPPSDEGAPESGAAYVAR